MGGGYTSRFDAATLKVENLAVARGERVLFADLSFSAGPGDFIEIRGANGVGKTSLLRAVAGFLRPAAGRVVIEGVEEPALALHVLGHRDGLKSPLDARAHVGFWGGLLGGAGDGMAALRQVGLEKIADLPARALSQGQGRRLALARLLVAPRPIWLLDEPAAGLDAAGKAMLAGLMDEYRSEGGMVLAAVHEPLGPSPSQTLGLA